SATRTGGGTREVGEMPDHAEVAERAGRREHAVGGGVAAEPFELAFDPRVEALHGRTEGTETGDRRRRGCSLAQRRHGRCRRDRTRLDAGRRGERRLHQAAVRPNATGASTWARSGSPPNDGHHGWKLHEPHNPDGCALKSPVTQA